MPSTAFSCPYCGASFALPDAATAARVECPRCHEVFPNRAALRLDASADTSAVDLNHRPAARSAAPRRSNRTVAVTVLGIMGTMAAIGLAFALWTVKDRRKHDRPNAPEASTARTNLPPTQLPAVGYLPG